MFLFLRTSSHNWMHPLNCLAFVIVNQPLHITLMWWLLENIIARSNHGSTLPSKTKPSCFPHSLFSVHQLHNVCCIYRSLKGKKIFGTILRSPTMLHQLKNTYWNTIANAAFFFLEEQWNNLLLVNHTYTPTPNQHNHNSKLHTHAHTHTHTHTKSLWIIFTKL